MLFTLLPPAKTGPAQPPQPGNLYVGKLHEQPGEDSEGGIRRCAPSEIRRGLESFLDEAGELRLLFPDCLPLAAPFVLFRLKRQGFSGCYVRSSQRGLYVAARR